MWQGNPIPRRGAARRISPATTAWPRATRVHTEAATTSSRSNRRHSSQRRQRLLGAIHLPGGGSMIATTPHSNGRMRAAESDILEDPCPAPFTDDELKRISDTRWL